MKLLCVCRHSLLLLLAGSLLGLRAGQGDETSKEDVKSKADAIRFVDRVGFRLPEGFHLDIVAKNPAVVHPVALAFADDGTPYVIEHPSAANDIGHEENLKITYKDGTAREFRTRSKKTKDVIKTLVASKPGGAWDASKVVLEIDQAAGLLPHDGWLYVASRGSVRRYKPSKVGGAFDISQFVAHGFCPDGDRQVSGLAIGPDGWLYISAGADDHFVEGSDGSRATVRRTGAIFRCKPDGSRIHTYAIGFQNPARESAFDLAGHLFLADAGIRAKATPAGSRLMSVPEGADYGWRLAARSETKADKARSTLTGDRPGRMAPLAISKKGSTAGVLIYNDTCLPESFRGLLLQTDPNGKAIHALNLAQAGATFRAGEAFDLVAAPKDAQFQPRQTVVGPDGAIYFVDERRASGAKANKSGRIYRLRWAGTKEIPAIPLRGMDSWAKILELADADLIKALSADDASRREIARRELVRRGEKNRPALLKLLSDEDVTVLAKASAVGVLQSMFNTDVQKALLTVLGDEEDELRRLAAEVLGLCAKRGDVDVFNGMLKVMSAEDRDVRRTVAIALGRLQSPGSADSLATALAFDKSTDRYYADGIVRALEMLGKPGINALLRLADSGVQKETDRVATTFLGLRTQPALDALSSLLRNPHLSTTQRADLVLSCLNYSLSDSQALDGVVGQIAGDRKENDLVKKALLYVLLESGVANSPKCASFVETQLGSKDYLLRQSAIETAVRLHVKTAGPVLVKMLAEELADQERLAIVQALQTLGAKDKAIVEAVKSQMRQDSAAIQAAALRTLAALDPEMAGKEATANLDSKESAVQREAVLILTGTVEGARNVAQRFLDGKLPSALRPEVVAGLEKHAGNDGDCAKLLTAIKKSDAKR